MLVTLDTAWGKIALKEFNILVRFWNSVFVKQLIGMQFMPLLFGRYFVMRSGIPESLNGWSIFKLQSKAELNGIFWSTKCSHSFSYYPWDYESHMFSHHESLYLEYDLTSALLFLQKKGVRLNFMNLLHSIDTVIVFATVIHSPKVIPRLTFSLYQKVCYILSLPNSSLSVLWSGLHPMDYMFVDIFAFPSGSHAPSENMGRLDIQLFVSLWK